jgi:hypothetical protein
MALLLETLGARLALNFAVALPPSFTSVLFQQKTGDQNAWRKCRWHTSKSPTVVVDGESNGSHPSQHHLSGILLLVTAFSLATPGIKYIDPPREQTVLVRLMQR